MQCAVAALRLGRITPIFVLPIFQCDNSKLDSIRGERLDLELVWPPASLCALVGAGTSAGAPSSCSQLGWVAGEGRKWWVEWRVSALQGRHFSRCQLPG